MDLYCRWGDEMCPFFDTGIVEKDGTNFKVEHKCNHKDYKSNKATTYITYTSVPPRIIPSLNYCPMEKKNNGD